MVVAVIAAFAIVETRGRRCDENPLVRGVFVDCRYRLGQLLGASKRSAQLKVTLAPRELPSPGH